MPDRSILLSHQTVRMQTQSAGGLRKVTDEDLVVGLVCADRDGNRVRIDRLNETGTLAFHYVNDELRVQEGVQELPRELFLAKGWHLF